MSRKFFLTILILCMCLISLVGHTEVLTNQADTDVPGMPTQDSVRFIQLLSGYLCETQQPEEHPMRILKQLFDFVYEQKNRPVRYYDEETQAEIQALINDVDPDILHMPEYMTVLMTAEDEAVPDDDEYTFDMFIDVDYVPGQLVVAVFGTDYESDQTLQWHPYLCEVPENGRIIIHIPEEDIERFRDNKVLLNILTDRVGAREVIWHEEEITERIVRPSKSEEVLRRVVHYTTEEDQPIEDDFRLFTRPLNADMLGEVERMSLFLKEQPSLYYYFTADIQNEMRLLFPPETDMDALIAYEIIGVRDENYHDTYGDVAALLQFAVNYTEQQHVVAMLGFPEKQAADDAAAPKWEWTCMRANVKEGGVEAIFEQLMLIRLDEEDGLFVILSEPLPEAPAEDAQNSGRQD